MKEKLTLEDWEKIYKRAALPQVCGCYDHPQGRCRAKAVGFLCGPGAIANPQRHQTAVCREHGDKITTEYTAKLNETWTVVEVHKHFARMAFNHQEEKAA